jgi:hypothetical protein
MTFGSTLSERLRTKEALEKYRRLSVESTTSSGRSEYRAQALETERDLELLKNQRRAFLDNDLGIRPPSVDTVDKSKQMAAELAKIVAKDAKATALIVDLATRGLEAFNQARGRRKTGFIVDALHVAQASING